MEIRNIEQARVELKQDMRQNLKRFAVYFLIVFAVIHCGLLIFFYVEECYSYTPVEPKYHQKCIELCNEIINLKKNSASFLAKKISKQMENVTKNCVQKHCLINKGILSPFIVHITIESAWMLSQVFVHETMFSNTVFCDIPHFV